MKMGSISVKTVCKGTALLIFVILRGLNTQTDTDITSLPVTSNISSTELETEFPQTHPTTPATISTLSTESQTDVPAASATTSSPSTEIQTSAPITPATSSSPSTESETSAPTNITSLLVSSNISSTELETEFPQTHPTTAPATTSTLSTESQTDVPAASATTRSPSTEIQTSAPITPATSSSPSTESETSAPTKPDVIRNLTVTEITTSSVFLTWEEPAGNRSFFKINWTDEKTSNHVTTNNLSYNITGLTAGVNYTFIITAVAADKSTEGESVVTSKYTKPDVIRNLRLSEITTSSVFLTWEEPARNRYFFILNWTDEKLDLTRNSIETTNTSYNITGLTAGVNYTFIITAVAADKSTEGESVVTSNYTKPDVIMNLTAVDITTSSVLLNWIKPNGQSSRYRVEYENNSVTTENTSIEINDLIPGEQYTFRVFAVAADHVTEGRARQISLYTNPDVIRNLTVNNITSSSVFLTWEEPIGNRSFFKLKWADDKTSGNSTETTNTSYHITGLTAGVNYTFCITAVTADKSAKGETVCRSQFTSMQSSKIHVSYYKAHLNYLTIMGGCSRHGKKWVQYQSSC
ncbi:receptor-type tyrosine-protein phosphatase eta-like isoform X2 [Sinocyclocheilus anshuiensis]|uniref:receptor-type tyrosine-protein phosphatase eta-like isoform X2 n=1 Tax=Sinocyclocheilus anshuiensis TaxID=1608454 RepID=UPI0007B863AA|nr:PREDICTED: receptor-type tyrosine-protein phosphatase eta-like isoform X2 [Sinocyclocheilus anshuiensis]